MTKDKYVAFIPVRGGSKSIPLKNIKKIAGQPLVYWTIDAAVNAKKIDKVYISTDSEDIRKIVGKYSKKNKSKLQVISRSEETATDTASTESAMLEFANNYEFENIILIQATSPLLTTQDLEEGIKKHESKKFDSILSVVLQKRFLWKPIKNGVTTPTNYDYMNRPRRQNFEGFLVENGAFYINSKKNLLKTKNRLFGKIGYQEMNENSYCEIDEPCDWVIVEKLIREKYKMNKK
ncbi:MAG: Acylneuraminate cytidylyltransferase [candidate division WS6 bacterium GW2011_GWC1_36_11]|uniref:Acylneuraminate cytidylyltransferase n=2 Tax=Candidatus Dojkabacteria TaxID=74243 RepID=A0A0G0DBI6_9BACT|nr:MAG: Acylneuraminate cytidylyltransferase [candidate division WS6 bacterium GW2011_GWC1_36_11]KKQ04737.1 MAG: Acylneuraminate cytidylyltransferase [candidate division WS6 bacterium GW2011_WS6_36_26]KKQ17662.1 MAG: Acylneuraminate cytidylyltransferase [candidate division WS6 bacterium GW2011_GWF1_36_8]HAM96752.1 hypothetical protein [Patescibacteria group bacterium]